PYLFLYFFFARLLFGHSRSCGFFTSLTTSGGGTCGTGCCSSSFYILANSATTLLSFLLFLIVCSFFLVFLLNRFFELRKIYFLSCKIRTIKLGIFCTNGISFTFFTFLICRFFTFSSWLGLFLRCRGCRGFCRSLGSRGFLFHFFFGRLF